MKLLIIALSVLILLGVVFNTNATETFSIAETIITEFDHSVNQIRYTFLPDTFKGSLATNDDLGVYVVGNEEIPVIRYINTHTTYDENGKLLYSNVWDVEIETLIKGQGGNAPAIRYEAEIPGFPDCTVFWFPTVPMTYYGQDYEFMINMGWKQYFFHTLNDLKDFPFTFSQSRIGVMLAIEEKYNVGDFVRKELID